MVILEAIALSSSLSLDAFTAGFAYGSNKIKIRFLAVQVINIICSLTLGIALVLGDVVKDYISSWVTAILCFSILFLIGLIKLLDSITKSVIRKYNDINKELKFSFFNFKFILKLYADPELADVDCSKTLSTKEAIALATSLSLDGLAVRIWSGSYKC